jgi:alpha-tubulin suppressor-like RCC1 family protein
MNRRIYLFSLIAFAWLAGARGIALGQTPNVHAWGTNAFGELGNGTTSGEFGNSNWYMPTDVNSLTGAVAIAAGFDFSLALRSDGTVWAWGYGMDGELGTGGTGNSDVPVQVGGLTGVVAIASGEQTGLALKSRSKRTASSKSLRAINGSR